MREILKWAGLSSSCNEIWNCCFNKEKKDREKSYCFRAKIYIALAHVIRSGS